MPKLMRKRALLAKIESSYGTDPTPTGAANAILLKNLELTPIAATTVSRDLIRPYLGGFDQLIADTHVEVTFEVEMAASGTAGTAPAYGPLLRACGFSETINVGTSVVYTPVSASFESVTIYVNYDGVQHKITGCYGSLDVDITANQIPVYKFKMVGKYNAPTDVALPTAVYTGFVSPLLANNTNTTPFSFISITTLVLQSLKLSINNSVDFRALIGSEYTQITDRQMNGNVQFESPALSTLNIFSNAVGIVTGALSITHGTVAGNKVAFAMTKIDVGQPTYSDSNGVVMIDCPVNILPTSGNDEMTITLT